MKNKNVKLRDLTLLEQIQRIIEALRLSGKIDKVIDGIDVFLAIFVLLDSIEGVIKQIDDKDICIGVIGDVIKQLDKVRKEIEDGKEF